LGASVGYSKRVALLLLASLAGAYLGSRRERKNDLFWASGVAALCSYAYVQRDIVDGGIQYSLGLVVCGMIGLAGAMVWLSRLTTTWLRVGVAVAVACGSLILCSPLQTSRRFDLSAQYDFDDYIRNTEVDAGVGRKILIWFGDYDFDAARFRQIVMGEGRETANV